LPGSINEADLSSTFVVLRHHPFSSDRDGDDEDRFRSKNRSRIIYCKLAQALFLSGQGDSPMVTLTTRLFWDKKIRIAILTFATFMALC
jgi:hypothetical protein